MSNKVIRTCVGCRRREEQAALVRHAVVDGRVVPDAARRLPGRGAYLHPGGECLQLALQRGAFPRAFRSRVEVAGLAGR